MSADPPIKKMPPEMRVLVFSELSAIDLQQARRICALFRDEIDGDHGRAVIRNVVSLHKHVEKTHADRMQNQRSMDGLHDFIRVNVAQLPDTVSKLKTAARSFAAHLSRHPSDPSPRFNSDFHILWKHQCTGEVGSLGDASQRGVKNTFILMLALDHKFHPRMGNVRIANHDFGEDASTHDDHDEDCRSPEAFYEAMWREMQNDAAAVEEAFGPTTFQAWSELYCLLRDTPGGIFAGVNGLIRENQQSWQPLLRLTGVPASDKTTLPKLRRVCGRLRVSPSSQATQYLAPMFNMEEVVQTLGVPHLPVLPAVDVLAYGMRTQWAWDRFKEAVDGGIHLQPIVRSAVLQELYIV